MIHRVSTALIIHWVEQTSTGSREILVRPKRLLHITTDARMFYLVPHRREYGRPSNVQ